MMHPRCIIFRAFGTLLVVILGKPSTSPMGMYSRVMLEVVFVAG
jgi:hypothetical protein